jgi:Protein of unknown function (DUF1838)
MSDPLIDRRAALAASTLMFGAGALGIANLARAQAAPKAGSPPAFDAKAFIARFDPDEPGFNPGNPYHNAEVFSRMQLGNNGKSNYGWFKGRVFAVIGDDKVLQPLFDLEGFGTNRHIKIGTATYQHLHREVGYYKDLRTGQIMERWANPMLGGEIVDVFPIYNDPVNAIIGPIVQTKLGEDMANAEFPFIMPWTNMGGLAMSSFDVNTQWRNVLDPAEWPRESTGKPFVRVSEYLQFYTEWKKLQNWRKHDRILQHGAWQRLGTWLPWMLMGSRPGHLFYRSHTKALNSIDELPKDIRAYTEKRFPQYLEAPTAWSEPNVTSFEVYKRDAKPKPL